jgi:hypothetical protein
LKENILVYRPSDSKIAFDGAEGKALISSTKNEDFEERGTVACLGSVGEDEDGERYRDLLSNEKIVSLFETFKGKETGKCAVITFDTVFQ